MKGLVVQVNLFATSAYFVPANTFESCAGLRLCYICLLNVSNMHSNIKEVLSKLKLAW